MNDYYFSVSLRIDHPSLDLTELTQILKLNPFRTWKVGEQRTMPNGKPLEGLNKFSLWTAYTHDEKHLYSTNTSIDEYIDQLNHKFKSHKDKFAEIYNSGGTIQYYFSLFSEDSLNGFLLDAKLLKSTSDLNISIGFDLYGYETKFNEEDSH